MFFRVSMFITSFLPLWFCISIFSALSISVNPLINKVILCLVIGINFISVIIIEHLIFVSKKNKESQTSYKVINASKKRNHSTEFIVAITLPLVVFDFNNWRGVLMFSVFFLMLLILCVKNNNLYPNIYLELRGYNYYCCDLNIKMTSGGSPKRECIVLSKNELHAEINRYKPLYELVVNEIYLDVSA